MIYAVESIVESIIYNALSPLGLVVFSGALAVVFQLKFFPGVCKLMEKDIFEHLSQMAGNAEPAALVTIIESTGSAPGKTGFKMLVDLEGNTLGTVGGGRIEATVIRDAVEAIKKNASIIRKYRLDNEQAGGLGMICGGDVTVFIDVIIPPESLLIIGAGHIAQPLAAMAKIVGFHVTVMDDREEFCNSERFPTADQCLVGEIPELLQNWKITRNTYITIVTRGHEHDQIALEKTLLSGAYYLGMIGSEIKVQTIYNNLMEKGFSEKELEKVHAPIGLDIKAITAEEIAVSILAQLIFEKNKAKAYKGVKFKNNNTCPA